MRGAATGAISRPPNRCQRDARRSAEGARGVKIPKVEPSADRCAAKGTHARNKNFSLKYAARRGCQETHELLAAVSLTRIASFRESLFDSLVVSWARTRTKFFCALGSTPTAPTNHLPDWSGLNKFARGQKGADKAIDPVLVRQSSAARVTTGFGSLHHLRGNIIVIWLSAILMIS